MRVVSLHPAATAWLAAFGAADLLVGRSHLCRAPGIEAVPVVSTLAADLPEEAAALDAAVRAAAAEGRSLYALDHAALARLRPDLVIVQAQCGVCAVSPADLSEALPPGTEVLAQAPMTFKQALDAALELGRRVGRLREAMTVLGRYEARLQALRARLGARRDGSLDGRPPPRVAVVEWVAPPMTAGHWAPDVVRLAGGEPVGAEGGAPSRTTTWAALAEVDPDVLLVAACDRTVAQALADLEVVRGTTAWDDLRAVRAGRVAVLDGATYLNSPGPSLYRSVELVAAALHGPRAGVTVRPDELQRLVEPVAA